MTAATETATGAGLIEAQVRNVAVLRNIARGVREAWATRVRAFEIEHAAEIADAKLAQGKAEEAETALRSLVLANYTATKDRIPAKGVEVKITTASEFDETAALKLAMAKGFAVHHELDRKAFATIAPTLSDDDRAAVRYRVVEQPKCYIATDLDKALGA